MHTIQPTLNHVHIGCTLLWLTRCNDSCIQARAKLTQIVESQADAEKKKDEAEIMSDALAQQDAHISLKACTDTESTSMFFIII